MLLGLIEPTAGSAQVLGAPIGDRRARAKLGFLPEHFRFPDWLTGRELLRFYGRLYGMGGPTLGARADELLARVDLLDAAHQPIRTYSKGMMQRVGLAQALLNRPQLVFLDEPTSGLDPLGRLLVRDIIRELRAEGTAVFLNSHLLGEVEATCDRVVFVKAGRTVHELRLDDEDGLDIELRVGPFSNGTIEMLERFGRVERTVPLTDSMHAFEGETRLRLRLADEEALPDLARSLVERGVALYEMRLARKSLEAWFLEVMGDEQRPG
jgi:ABC-2 type transport system ATP-binding protein